MGGEHRTDSLTFDGEHVRFECEEIECPHAGAVGIKLERQQAAQTDCNRRLAEARPPLSLAQVIASGAVLRASRLLEPPRARYENCGGLMPIPFS